MIGNQSLQIFFKTFEKYPLDQVGLNVYALADAAQDKTFLKVLEHLRQKCLLTEAGGEKARERLCCTNIQKLNFFQVI
jgi:hypothetical protein